MARSNRLAAGVVMVVSLNACLLFNIDRNIDALTKAGSIKGSFTAKPPRGHAGFVVLLHEQGGKWERITTRVFYAPAPFDFLAVPGKLRLFAFVDSDGNSAWDQNDPSMLADIFEVPAGKEMDVGALHPEPGGPPPPIQIEFDPKGSPKDLVEFHHGDLATLSDERFSPESGKLGLWQPVDFARTYGLGVSFLEPYDAKKIPVLMVHGAGGSPRHFETMIAHLDREHFQPWIYSYPSGGRLGRASENLGSIVDDLQRQLGFDRMIVVGYSMGGLVAHSFVVAQPQRKYIRMLITVSAPYGGDESAQEGVAHLPIVPPFFIDMAQDSVFLQSLRHPMPPMVPHVMLFSYGKTAGGKDPNDGIVSLRSLLEPEVQQAASVMRGFPETHKSVMESDAVMAAMNSAMRSAPTVSER
jgi:pimeloyl-ACP methyl ester carboxylesterase